MPTATAIPTFAPPPRNNAAPIAAVAIVVALVVGGIFYLKHEEGIRDAELKSVPAAGSDAAPSGAQAKGALDLTSKPDGCAIWVDGDLRSEVTPAHLDKLPLGKPIKIKLTKEGFEAFRSEVVLSEAEPSKKLAAEMRTGSVTVVLKIDPPPTLWLDGRPWTGERTKIVGLSAGEDHKIVASASGFQARTYTINAQQGETKTIIDQLPRGGDPGAPVTPAPKEDKPAPAPAGAPAKVRVGAKGGFCNVSVNGTSYGPTPVEAVVSAGRVTISCKPANGPSQSQTVNVAAGDTARVSFKIEE
jgi:serine/threonine-protein kinase